MNGNRPASLWIICFDKLCNNNKPKNFDYFLYLSLIGYWKLYSVEMSFDKKMVAIFCIREKYIEINQSREI